MERREPKFNEGGQKQCCSSEADMAASAVFPCNCRANLKQTCETLRKRKKKEIRPVSINWLRANAPGDAKCGFVRGCWQRRRRSRGFELETNLKEEEERPRPSAREKWRDGSQQQTQLFFLLLHPFSKNPLK